MTIPPSDPWAVPPGPSGYEPVPPGGYQVPPGFGQPGYGFDPANDPLVPPPGSGLQGWVDRVTGTLRRSGWPLMQVLLVTFALPQVAVAVIGFALASAMSIDVDSSSFVDTELGFGYVGLILVLSLVAAFVSAVGWGAGIWVVAQEAAGRRTALAEALQAGLRRGLPMFGWYLLYGLMVAGGLILCVLPGLYFAVAGVLFGLVVMFEHSGGIGRSFALVNSAFGAALGRVLLLVLVYVAGSVAVAVPFGVAGVAVDGLPGTGFQTTTPTSVLDLVGQVVSAALGVVLGAVMLVGLLVTYTQLRSRTEQISTASLADAADRA